jgi:putative spermidine/putrescine transport system permease protein
MKANEEKIRNKAHKRKPGYGNTQIIFKLLLTGFVFSVLFPFAVIVIWSFAGRWAWPHLVPENFSLRGMQELFGGYSGAMQILLFSVVLSVIVAVITVVIAAMTARALVFYDFCGKRMVDFGTILPIIVPGTVFAMGVNVLFIQAGLSDSAAGVILAHVICSLPYAIKIMTDVTAAFGRKLEEQAAVLGASARQTMAYVTFPSLMPGLISSGCMAYIVSFSQYFLTLIIGGGNVMTFSVKMVPYLQSGDRTIASAYSMVFICSTLFVFLIFEKTVRKFGRDESGYFFL